MGTYPNRKSFFGYHGGVDPMMKMRTYLKRLLLVVLVATLTACAGAPKRAKTISQDHFAEIKRPDIPLVMNDRVQDWIDYFQGKGRVHFERYLRRSGKYIPMMRRILKSHGMPDDLVYLSMIESGFNPHAYSSARATGAWQFIYHTGIRYGLKVNSWVDERRDPEKSTVAAAKYLKDLYDRFNNWYLAAAGYNAGEGKIDRAIQKYDTEDFWKIAKEKYLRTETKDYVPKLIAAAMLAKHPAKYGFKGINYEEPVLFEEVVLEGPVDLRVAAKCAGTSYDEMKKLNPEILHWVTPPDYKGYHLKVPGGAADRFRRKYASLSAAERLGGEKLKVEESVSIASLAREHGVPAVLLAAANGYSSDTTVKGGRSIVLPMDPPEGESFHEKVYERGKRGGKAIAYRIRRGDSIRSISRKTGISVAALKKYNSHVNWSKIRKGQKIKLYASAATVKKSRKGSEEGYKSRRSGGGKVAMVKKKGRSTHKVRSGDTLSEIAQRYKVSVSALKAANKISSPKGLRAGKTIKIPKPRSASKGSGGSPSM